MISHRLFAALKVALMHFSASLLVAVLCAFLVFIVWFPGPFREMAGGRELFFLVMTVDVICGPLLTLVLFNPQKPKSELRRDLGLVAVIQVAALIYGLSTVWQVRPLYLVSEIDRFKVIAVSDLASHALESLSTELQPHFWQGPQIVGLRDISKQERETVMFESVQGGRDYGERPEFYAVYEGAVALKSLQRARLLAPFLLKYPDQRDAAQVMADKAELKLETLRYLPVIGRQDWVALLDGKGLVIGFLKGDGF